MSMETEEDSRQHFMELNTLTFSVTLGKYCAEVLSWGLIEPRWWRNYLHIHSHFEVCYAFQGRGTFYIEGQSYPVQAGEVFIARPGEAHEIISTEDDPLGIYFWSYTLLPTREQTAHDNECDNLLTQFAQFQVGAQSISARVPGMQCTLELLSEEVMRHEVGYTQVLRGLITKLLLDTARAVVPVQMMEPAETFRARNSEEVVVKLMVHYLHDNYNRALSVRDVAAEVHLSERHANRLFHKVIGVPLIEYLTTYRMELAVQQLLEGSQTIKEVALNCGYTDVRHFTTLFRRRHGLTPGAFRRQGGTHFLTSTPENVHIQP